MKKLDKIAEEPTRNINSSNAKTLEERTSTYTPNSGNPETDEAITKYLSLYHNKQKSGLSLSDIRSCASNQVGISKEKLKEAIARYTKDTGTYMGGKLTDNTREAVEGAINSGQYKTLKEIANHYNISTSSIYRINKEVKRKHENRETKPRSLYSEAKEFGKKAAMLAITLGTLSSCSLYPSNVPPLGAPIGKMNFSKMDTIAANHRTRLAENPHYITRERKATIATSFHSTDNLTTGGNTEITKAIEIIPFNTGANKETGMFLSVVDEKLPEGTTIEEIIVASSLNGDMSFHKPGAVIFNDAFLAVAGITYIGPDKTKKTITFNF
jgi:hypothetical protein